MEHLAKVAGLDDVALRIRPSASNPGVLLEASRDAPTPEEPETPTKPLEPETPSEPLKPWMPGADPFDPFEPES